MTLTFQEVLELDLIEVVRDFHCVEPWSVPDNKWKGVPAHRILELADLLPSARFTIVRSLGGFETDLPLEALVCPDTLLVWE